MRMYTQKGCEYLHDLLVELGRVPRNLPQSVDAPNPHIQLVVSKLIDRLAEPLVDLVLQAQLKLSLGCLEHSLVLTPRLRRVAMPWAITMARTSACSWVSRGC